MAASTTQVSAFVTKETKELLERYTRKTGVKKQHVINQALQHHLQAMAELPTDMIVHPRLVLTAASGRKVIAELSGTPKPSKKLRELMSRDDD